MSLKPLKRLEMILDGQDIEPATRLEHFLKKAATEVPKPTSADAGKVVTVNEDGDGYVLAEGGGGSDCNCVYNFGSAADYSPFNVPDLINGGTRTFTPGTNTLYAPDLDGKAFEITGRRKMLYTDKMPPGYLTAESNVNQMIVTWGTQEVKAFSSTDTTDPGFAIVNATLVYIDLSDGSSGYIVNPENIVYMEVPGDK